MPDIAIKGPDGEFGAYMAMPASGSGPGLLVIQEIFGVNRVMRDLCDGYASQGYIAVCPDLFWRIQPGVQITDRTEDEWKQAFALMEKFLPDFEKGVGDLKATMDHIRNMDGCTGKVGCVGYCLGGSLTYAMACQSDSDASVGYYPVQIDDHLPYAEYIKKPAMFHVAETTGSAPRNRRRRSPRPSRKTTTSRSAPIPGSITPSPARAVRTTTGKLPRRPTRVPPSCSGAP